MKAASVAMCALALACACEKAKALEPDEYGMTGNDLLGYCQSEAGGPIASPDANPALAFCGGYIIGVHDTLLFAGSTREICQPTTGVTNRQIIDIVVKYLVENPATRNKDAAILSAIALNKAYPCP